MIAAASGSLLAVLVAVSAIGPAATQIFLPALPAIQSGFGVSTGAAQLALSLALLATAVTTLAWGPCSDRAGRRPVMIAGLLLYLAGSLVCAVAPSVGVLVAGRIVQAGGGACGAVLARAIVQDAWGPERAARVLSLVAMAMVVPPMVAPLAGGLLTDSLGWRSTFVAAAAPGLAVLVLVLGRLPETREGRRVGLDVGGMLGSFGRLLASPLFCAYAFQSAFSMGIFFAFIAGAPYMVVQVLGRPATDYGLWFMAFAAGYVVGSLGAVRLSERAGVDRMVLGGSLLSLAAAGGLATLTALGVWEPWAIFLPSALIAAFNGLSLPNAQAGAINVDPPVAGAASSLIGFLQMALGAVVAQAVGLAQDGTPYAMVAVMVALAAAAFLAIAGKLALRLGGPAPA